MIAYPQNEVGTPYMKETMRQERIKILYAMAYNAWSMKKSHIKNMRLKKLTRLLIYG